MLQFDGAIAGMGTASGTRLVVGMWPLSPYGSVTDVMIERADGHRILLAPTQELADFIAATYEFDEVRVTPVLRVRDGKKWMVSTDELALTFDVGGRPPLGWVLTAVPRGLARARWWTTLQDPIARVTMDGVRTRGTAGGGRREWYSAHGPAPDQVGQRPVRRRGTRRAPPGDPAGALRLRLHPGGTLAGQGALPRLRSPWPASSRRRHRVRSGARFPATDTAGHTAQAP